MNPTILGALPGYYNSAYGITATITPSKRLYVSLGTYDGNGARGEQTGLREAPTFNSYRFNIGEIGTAWLLGPDGLPGAFGVGAWNQTGRLTLATSQRTITQDGTYGAYSFASQRLWSSTCDGNAKGVSGFAQFGANDSRTMIATEYVGLGVTAFGLIPGRPRDSVGAGLACSWLNRNRGLVRRGVATDLRPDPRDRRHLSGTCPDGGAEPRREDRRQARGRLHGAIHDPVLNVPLP